MKHVPLAMPAVAAAAMAVAALGATEGTGSISNAFPHNRTFPIGEEHVYVIQRSQTVTVRYRSASGDLVSKDVARQDAHSVAFTVEGYADGAAVVAVADERAQVETWPSPSIRADGTISQAGPLAALAAAGLVFGGASPPPLADGAKWTATGKLSLPFGPVTVQINNVSADWQGDSIVQAVTATGSLDAGGTVIVPGFGTATLRGGGTAAGVSYVDMGQALLLGSSYALTSAGNATNRRGEAGTYTMKAVYTLELARFVPGRPGPQYMAPTELPRMIETVAPDSDIMHGGGTDQIAHPAPTDNIMREPGPAPQSPLPLPEMSLAPVPLPQIGGVPLASPPAPPPTPMPTRSPR